MSQRKKIVFISGANRGIGYGLSQLMAEKNYLVIAGYRDEARSERLLKDSDQSDSILPFKADVLAEEELERLHRFIDGRIGRSTKNISLRVLHFALN